MVLYFRYSHQNGVRIVILNEQKWAQNDLIYELEFEQRRYRKVALLELLIHDFELRYDAKLEHKGVEMGGVLDRGFVDFDYFCVFEPEQGRPIYDRISGRKVRQNRFYRIFALKNIVQFRQLRIYYAPAF